MLKQTGSIFEILLACKWQHVKDRLLIMLNSLQEMFKLITSQVLEI